MTAYIECCFRWGQEPFWVPILPSGIFVKDLSRAIKDRLDCVTSELFVAHPVTAVPYPGKKWLYPYEPVRVWVVPLGQVPNVGHSGDGGHDGSGEDPCPSTQLTTGKCEEEDNEGEDTDSMPFHAVRVGRKPGIYLSKAEVKPQIIDFPGAEHKTFASFAEADAYLRGSGASVEERDLMSAGSRAKHPPSKSTPPIFSEHPDAAAAAAAAAAAEVSIINAVFHCLTDPETRTAYCVAALYPACRRDAAIVRNFIIEDASSPSRAELTSAVLVLQACVEVPGYVPGRTLVRTYCASTYATNAINDYAVNKSVFTGANSATMAVLASLLKAAKVRAFWTAQTDPTLSATMRQTIKLRLSGGEAGGGSCK